MAWQVQLVGNIINTLEDVERADVQYGDHISCTLGHMHVLLFVFFVTFAWFIFCGFTLTLVSEFSVCLGWLIQVLMLCSFRHLLSSPKPAEHG